MILLIMAMLLSLTACGYRLETGTIVEKKYTPQREVVMWMDINGILCPINHIEPARYSILVDGIDEAGTKCTEWWSVDAVEYARLQVGMEVVRNEE